MPPTSSQSSFRPAAQANPLDDYTFGIELEFFLLYPEAAFAGKPWDDKYHPALYYLHQALLKAGVGATSYQQINDVGYPRAFNSWRIDLDAHEMEASHAMAVPQGYGGHSVELTSPKYRFSDEAEWKQEIDKVIKVLEDMQRGVFRVFTNSECGFHVHIGNSRAPIALDTAKNLLQIVTGFERCFDVLHTVPRIAHDNTACAPPSKFFLPRSRDPKDWIDLIAAVDSHSQLRRLFAIKPDRRDPPTTGANSAYNFDHLRPNHPKGFNTIEFRQHTGTLDCAEIAAWVTLCGTLVAACAAQKPSDVRHWVRRLGTDPTPEHMNPQILMRVLGVPPAVIRFYESRLAVAFRPAPVNRWVNPVADAVHARNTAASPPGDAWHVVRRLVEDRRRVEGRLESVMAAVVAKFEKGGYGDWRLGREGVDAAKRAFATVIRVPAEKMGQLMAEFPPYGARLGM